MTGAIPPRSSRSSRRTSVRGGGAADPSRVTGLNGFEATARIVKGFPGSRVIVFSMHGTKQHVLQAMRSGAVAYLVKEARPAELESAIRAVARGETYLGTAIAGHVVVPIAHPGGT